MAISSLSFSIATARPSIRLAWSNATAMNSPSNLTGRTAFEEAEQYVLALLNIASRASLDPIPRERLYCDQLAISCSRAIWNDGMVLPTEPRLRLERVLVVVGWARLAQDLHRSLPGVLEEARRGAAAVFGDLGRDVAVFLEDGDEGLRPARRGD